MSHNVILSTSTLSRVLKSLSSVISNTSQYSTSPRWASKMKSWQIYQYGGIGELTFNKSARIATIESPNEILVKVHAASVNPIDVRMIGGYGNALINVMRKGKGIIKVGSEFPLTVGRDFSGTVVEVGKGVKRFKTGDEVWGAIRAERPGTHAEYTICSQDEISRKPCTISHQEAASIPYVAATAWSALCTIGQLKEKNTPGKRILILGGSGGIGTFCIQMLKAWGADVTVTCSGDALDLVTQLGADTAIDYTSHNVWQALESLPKFDVILDTVEKNDCEKALPLLSQWKSSVLVTLSPPLLNNSDSYGVLPGLLRSAVSAGIHTLKGAATGKSLRWGVFTPNGSAMHRVTQMVEQEQIKPILHQSFALSDIPDAFQAVSDGHLRGKIVINMMEDT